MTSVRILIGDCRETLRQLPDNSVDSVCCDPPYHLTSIVKRFGSPDAAPCKAGATGVYQRSSTGFMGQQWDGGDVAFRAETWAEVLRVLKPSGHLLAFSGTRTYHRLACAVEDAGFEIRDMISWHYGSGFPKSHNINKKLEGEVCGCTSNDQLRGMREGSHDASSVVSAGEEADLLPPMQRPIAGPGMGQAWPQGRSGAEADAGHEGAEEPGLEGWRLSEADARQLSGGEVSARTGLGETDGEGRRLHYAASLGDGADVRIPADANGSGESQGSQPGEQSSFEPRIVADQRGSQAWRGWPLCGGCGKPILTEGLGTALKPSSEPIVLARKPLIGTVAANVLAHGTGALNIDGCRIEAGEGDYDHPGNDRSGSAGNSWNADNCGFSNTNQKPPNALGRWPANLCHDGSEEVLAGFPDTESGTGAIKRASAKENEGNSGAAYGAESRPAGTPMIEYGDKGSAARFFYCAKAATEERGEGNNHPTVKPVALMEWLVTLVTPKGGTVLDPFMGSGSTGLACQRKQFNFIGCELSADYAAIAERRLRDDAGMFASIEVLAPDAPKEAAA